MEEKKTINFSWIMVLGIVFLVLKLVGAISWAWVWVLAPFWMPIALYFALANIWILIVNILEIFGR